MAHGFSLFGGQGEEAAGGFDGGCFVVDGDDVAGLAVVDDLPAAAAVGDDEGSAAGCGLEEDVAHALGVVGGVEEAAAVLVVGDHVLLLAVVGDDALFLGLGQDLGVFFVVAHAADVEFAVVSFSHDRAGGGQEEVDALFFHDPGDKEEADLVVFGIGELGVSLQADAGAGQEADPAGGGQHFVGFEKFHVFRILEKDAGGLADAGLVEGDGQLLDLAGVLHGGPQAGDVGVVGDVEHGAGHSAVGVGLDVVGEDRVGSDLFEDGPVGHHEFEVGEGVGAVAADGEADQAAAHVLELFFK